MKFPEPPPQATDILDFWFGDDEDDGRLGEARAALWFSKSVERDQEIEERFGSELEAASRNERSSWAESPRGRLALIVLLDQFSRNVFRDTPRAFAQDSLALDLCLEGLERGDDLELRPIERTFFYLPMEHSEDGEIQDRSVASFRTLAAAVPEAWRSLFEGYTDYAERHREIIARFGRFPHRNAILGRDSTSEELEFLRQPGSSF